MEVVCPVCHSKFNLPDKLAVPGRKLRCSVCKEIFQFNSPSAAEPVQKEVPVAAKSTPEKEGAKSSVSPRRVLLHWVLTIVGLACAAAIIGGLVWSYAERIEAPQPQTNQKELSGLAQKLEKLKVIDVRQYYVENAKTGSFLVIEGRVVNGFETSKGFIEVEALLYGDDQRVLASARQMAGTSLSLFELQVKEEKELQELITNNLEITANNSTVPPAGEVPFMILFFQPPPNIGEFGVRIVDVQDAAPSGR